MVFEKLEIYGSSLQLFKRCEEEGVIAVEVVEDAREERGGEVETFEDAHIVKEEKGMVCVEEARNWLSY